MIERLLILGLLLALLAGCNDSNSRPSPSDEPSSGAVTGGDKPDVLILRTSIDEDDILRTSIDEDDEIETPDEETIAQAFRSLDWTVDKTFIQLRRTKKDREKYDPTDDMVVANKGGSLVATHATFVNIDGKGDRKFERLNLDSADAGLEIILSHFRNDQEYRNFGTWTWP